MLVLVSLECIDLMRSTEGISLRTGGTHSVNSLFTSKQSAGERLAKRDSRPERHAEAGCSALGAACG